MKSNVFSIRQMVAVGIGAALVFVFMRFVVIPSGIPNTNINIAAAVLAVFAAIFGPVTGFLIGFIAHSLTDLTWGGVWWSWVIADAIFGLLVGLFFWSFKIEQGGFTAKKCIIFNLVQIAANAIAWIGVAPSLDILIYKEPANKVYLQGVTAAAINAAAVLVIASLVAFTYSKTRVKAGSLHKED
ncbi:MAG: ECF-type riboflavin transporter substrate-binding protein [Treponemataceae bacterium]|nr:MAG: ECF-type riboflavin transporter substrate-binding protein [Treponemataceae bacterium]